MALLRQRPAPIAYRFIFALYNNVKSELTQQQSNVIQFLFVVIYDLSSQLALSIDLRKV